MKSEVKRGQPVTRDLGPHCAKQSASSASINNSSTSRSSSKKPSKSIGASHDLCPALARFSWARRPTAQGCQSFYGRTWLCRLTLLDYRKPALRCVTSLWRWGGGVREGSTYAHQLVQYLIGCVSLYYLKLLRSVEKLGAVCNEESHSVVVQVRHVSQASTAWSIKPLYQTMILE